MPAKSPRPRGACVAIALVAATAAAVPAALPAGAPAAPGPASTIASLEAVRAQERALAGRIAMLTRLVGKLEADIAPLARRQASIEAQLRERRAALDRAQRDLRSARGRLAVLRRELARARTILAGRLRALYMTAEPDAFTVVVISRGWIDLLERAEFLQRINDQDRRIVRHVRASRDDAQRLAVRLATLERRQRRLTTEVLRRRDDVAATRSLLDAKRAGAAQARASVRVALRAVSRRRGRLESRLAALGAAYGRLGADLEALGPLAGWAIPWSIVKCESGGRNHPPNSAGASGYYQIIPSTWRAFRGRGPAAWLAPKAEQDRVAARIWRAGAGAHNWVCAGR